MLEMLYWTCALGALIGTWCNIHNRPICYVTWLCTNAVWACSCYSHGMYAQAFQHTAYVGLSIYAIRRVRHGYWGWHQRRLWPASKLPDASPN
jgi:hypothetical protein